MITSRLFGGLGNQLFQYAAGQALARATGSQLQLDTRMARAGTHWDFGLDAFAIQAPVGTQLPPDKSRPLAYALWRGLGRRPKIFREKGLGYDPALFQQTGEIYLHGYWQSEKYFTSIESQLRSEFEIITELNAQNAEALDEIASGLSVSLHVRRGDYVSENKSNDVHGTCDASYYARALEYLSSRIGDGFTVYVFSDDIAWARENLSFDFPTRFFGHNGFNQAHEDLRLMKACSHNIIVNSTFSWWGGWLNPSPSKIVIAPQQWFNDPSMQNPDIIPDSWVRV